MKQNIQTKQVGMSYSKLSNIITFLFNRNPIVTSRNIEGRQDMIEDYDKDGNVVSLEILNADKYFTKEFLDTLPPEADDVTEIEYDPDKLEDD